jgi:hypothetical protein
VDSRGGFDLGLFRVFRYGAGPSRAGKLSGGKTVAEKKPHLLILSDEGDPVLKGRCSSCQGVTFSLISSTASSLALVHEMFAEHFRRVHLSEDDTQAAPKS